MTADLLFYPVASLSDSLAEGTLVLTPNHRLASRIRRAWAHYQVQQGATAWETPRVMSLDHWWQACYREHRMQNPAAPPLASAAQLRALWQGVIAQDDSAAGLLRPSATAEMASKAYETLLRWDTDWRETATRQLFEFSEDSTLFIRWADAFELALADCGLAMLDHALPQLAAEQTEPCIVLAEFSELAPLH
ncbi:MAG: hypothetical protein V2J89_13950, partial [Halieaceae bacterium]|nr:hypothetical protein [Halieaceae bacterium]